MNIYSGLWHPTASAVCAAKTQVCHWQLGLCLDLPSGSSTITHSLPRPFGRLESFGKRVGGSNFWDGWYVYLGHSLPVPCVPHMLDLAPQTFNASSMRTLYPARRGGWRKSIHRFYICSVSLGMWLAVTSASVSLNPTINPHSCQPIPLGGMIALPTKHLNFSLWTLNWFLTSPGLRQILFLFFMLSRNISKPIHVW